MGESAWRVDNEAHLLHIEGRTFQCDRSIEAAAEWNGHVLLLSSDTDCLSLWDDEGLVRIARVGVYPQDMTVQGDMAYVCGGLDGKLHALNMPDLHTSAEYPLIGMPERVCIHGAQAYVMSFIAEPEVHTKVLQLDLQTKTCIEIAEYPGLPGAIMADAAGIWIGVSELIVHLPWGSDVPDLHADGIGLPRHMERLGGGILVDDTLEGKQFFIQT